MDKRSLFYSIIF